MVNKIMEAAKTLNILFGGLLHPLKGVESSEKWVGFIGMLSVGGTALLKYVLGLPVQVLMAVLIAAMLDFILGIYSAIVTKEGIELYKIPRAIIKIAGFLIIISIINLTHAGLEKYDYRSEYVEVGVSYLLDSVFVFTTLLILYFYLISITKSGAKAGIKNFDSLSRFFRIRRDEILREPERQAKNNTKDEL